MRRILLLLVVLAAGAQAQMAEILKNQYHSEKELGVYLVKEVSALPALLANPECRLICLQVATKDLTVEQADALIKWVRTGRSLWFYDARQGPLFGFKPYLLKKEQFPNKPEEGEYAGHKEQGVATVGLALATHELLTGVGQVSMFMIPLEGGYYGTVACEKDTFPLLRINLQSPALSAMRREGRGAIVFKPLCWPEVLSGDRYQANLLEWCCGYQIPGPAGSEKIGYPVGPKAEFVTGDPAVPLLTPPEPAAAAAATPAPTPAEAPRTGQDKLACNDGNLLGSVMNEVFRFETGSETFNIKRADLKSLVIGGSIDLDQLTTWDGTVRRGYLLTPKIEFEVDKDVRTFPRRSIQRLDLAPPAAPPQK